MEFLRQELWSGLPFPSPEDFHNPGCIRYPVLWAHSLPSEPTGKPEFPINISDNDEGEREELKSWLKTQHLKN